MKLLVILAALALTASSADARPRSPYPPDYINVRNGDLYPVAPGRARAADYRAYRWTGWPAYRAKVREICARPGNACTQETRAFVRGPDANGNRIVECIPPKSRVEVDPLADDADRPSKVICR